MSKFLVEYTSFAQADMLIETSEDPKTSKKNWYMKGVFIQGGVRNLNGRIYPVNEISRAVDDVNAILARGEDVLGELDHPDKLTINLDRVSHKITGMWMDGNLGVGKLKVLPTPMGQLVQAFLESETKLGVSSRGSGDVNDQGYVSEFEIVTVDIVAKPSAPDAYPVPVYEALNSRRGKIINDLTQAVMHDPKAQKYLHTEVLNWIKKL